MFDFNMRLLYDDEAEHAAVVVKLKQDDSEMTKVFHGNNLLKVMDEMYNYMFSADGLKSLSMFKDININNDKKPNVVPDDKAKYEKPENMAFKKRPSKKQNKFYIILE